MQNKFNEEDKEKFVEFLNYVWSNSEYNKMKAEDMNKFLRLFGHMQNSILKKINSNILEVVAVHEDNKEE